MFLRRFTHKGLSQFVAIYGMLFFFSAQVSLALYTNSSFLSQTLDQFPLTHGLSQEAHERLIGAIYALDAVIAFATLIFLPAILRRYGNVKVTRTLVSLSMVALLLLAFGDSAFAIIPAFMLQSVMVSGLYFAFDVFLERYSKEESVGLVRGTALTIGGIAWMFPPSAAGIIAAHGDFTPIYLGGFVLLIPVFFLLVTRLRTFKDPPYHVLSLKNTVEEIRMDKNITGIFIVQGLLQFFYAWMIIYAPLYLHETLGVPWETIGLALTIALSAFVIFEIPAGEIADKYLGEKELLFGGLLVMTLGVILVPFTHTTTLFTWATVLFIGRMGASVVETMTETYFFKRVGPERTNVISFFRLMTPIAFLFAPIIASVILSWTGIQYIFVVLAFILLWGTTVVLRLKDTK